MKRRAFLRSASAAGAATAAAFAARAWPVRAARLRRFGGTLTAGLAGRARGSLAGTNPWTLDPHLARTRLERELAAAMHVPLLAPAPPHLAAREAGLLVTSITPSRDGRLWTIRLRERISFSDGTPLDAAAAAASLTRALGAPAGRALTATLVAARALDAQTLEVETRAPLADLRPILAVPSAAIVSTKTPPDPLWGPPGLGGLRAPRAGEAGKGKELLLLANERSPAGRAWIDRLHVVASEGPEAAALHRRGAMQVLEGRARAPESERVTGDAASTIVLLLSPRLSADLRARAAAAPDLRVLTDVFLQGAHPAASLIPPALFPASAAPLAPARARPPKPPSRTTLSLFVGDASSDMAPVVDRLVFDLLEVGIAATVGWKTPEGLEEAITNDRFDLALAEWVPLDLDPGRALAGAAREPVLVPALGDPAPLTALAAIDDADARALAAMRAADAVLARGLLVPLVHPRRTLRRTPAVEGLRLDAWGRVDWCEVSLE